MDHVSAIFGDKNKFLAGLPMNDDITFPPSPVAPEPSDQPVKTESVDVDLMRLTLYKMKDQLDILLHLLEGKGNTMSNPVSSVRPETFLQPTSASKNGTVLEGYFNGEKMISDDGQIFDIPQNYASKSKLVDGDRMKLSITNTGSFLYKQIKPIERQRIRGELVSGGVSGQWMVSSALGQFKVLTAAVTFHKGRIGDEVVLLIPASGHSDWGAVEHLIHKDF